MSVIAQEVLYAVVVFYSLIQLSSPDLNCSLILIIVQPTPQNCNGHKFDCMV